MTVEPTTSCAEPTTSCAEPTTSCAEPIEGKYCLPPRTSPGTLEKLLMGKFYFPALAYNQTGSSAPLKSTRFAMLTEFFTGGGYLYVDWMNHLGEAFKNLCITALGILGIAAKLDLLEPLLVVNGLVVFTIFHKIFSMLYIKDAVEAKNEKVIQECEHMDSTKAFWNDINCFYSDNMEALDETQFRSKHPEHSKIKDAYKMQIQEIRIPNKGDDRLVVLRALSFIPKDINKGLDTFYFLTFDGAGEGHTETLSGNAGAEIRWQPNGPELQSALIRAVQALNPESVIAYSMGGIWATSPSDLNKDFYENLSVRHIENDRTFAEISRLAGVKINDFSMKRILQNIVSRLDINFCPERAFPEFLRSLVHAANGRQITVEELREYNDIFSGENSRGRFSVNYPTDMSESGASVHIIHHSFPCVMPEATHSTGISQAMYNPGNTRIESYGNSASLLNNCIKESDSIPKGLELFRQKNKQDPSKSERVLIIGASKESGKFIPETVSARIHAHIIGCDKTDTSQIDQ